MPSGGLITALWEIETFYALYSPTGPQFKGSNPDAADVAEYVVETARPGSVILLHFTPRDVAALPAYESTASVEGW